jgi:hypothetical protein
MHSLVGHSVIHKPRSVSLKPAIIGPDDVTGDAYLRPDQRAFHATVIKLT